MGEKRRVLTIWHSTKLPMRSADSMTEDNLKGKKPLNFFRRSINETNEPTFDMISESNRCENLPAGIYIVSKYVPSCKGIVICIL